MSKDNSKDVFMAGYKEPAVKLLNYLKNVLMIPDAFIWNHIGYYVVSVPPQEYERALKAGREYACDNDIGMFWIDKYNERRAPIALSDIGYGLLPSYILDEEYWEERYRDRTMWGLSDAFTPKVILEYFNEMKKFMEVDRIVIKYFGRDRALSISVISPDYEKYSELLKEFVSEYGYGPFEEIHPLTYTGEYVKEPILTRKRGDL